MTRASFWIKDEQTETNIFLPPEKVEQYWVETAVLDVTQLDLLDLSHPAALFSCLNMTLAFLQKNLVNLEWKWLVLWKFLTRHISSVDAFYLLHFLPPSWLDQQKNWVPAEGSNCSSAGMTNPH
jgi:hypothetical protein